MDWQEQAQDLLQPNFLIDFSPLSFVYGCCLYSIAISPFASLTIYIVMQIELCQLFVYCWMGNRLIVRIEKLQEALYNVKWYSMSLHRQKEIQVMLIMAQNLSGFNGIFNEVNMETFQSVRLKECSYIFRFYLMFLGRFWNFHTRSLRYCNQ